MKRLTSNIAEALAKKFRVENGMSQTEAINLKSLLRKLNILTVFRPLSANFHGMSLQSPLGLKFMLINSNNAKGRQHFTIAHELYHLFFDEAPHPHVCHQNENEKNIQEMNADMFAGALLMPEDGLREFISTEEIKDSQIRLSTIIKMEQYFTVSRAAILVRLRTCKLINAAEYSRLQSIPVIESAKEYGYGTALYLSGNEGLVIGDFGEKARELYEKEVISEGHYRELLNLISDGKN
ncbi:MAG: ImmA/IrrE family metallo-endopeptidase [Tannerellaceae bacterium]